MNGYDVERHGAAERLHRPARALLDFSVSVNPLGPTKKVKAEIRRHLKDLGSYPDPDCSRLRRHIGRQLEVPPESVLCGNGSKEILYQIGDVLRPRWVLLTTPGYPEYARSVSSGDVSVKYLHLQKLATNYTNTEISFKQLRPQFCVKSLAIGQICEICAIRGES